MRVIKIKKSGNSTIVDIENESGTLIETFVFNALTDLILRNGVIRVKTCEITLNILYDELFDKLASTDIKDYLDKASALFFFNQDTIV